MKIEQVIVHYLLKNKELTLQGIGTFKLDAAVPDLADSDKPVALPENAVSFHFDPKAKEDDGLIDYIVQHTNKIKSLAASDLDSFLSLGRQFLNIGKPFTLQNLGTLEKISSGELLFKGGQLIAQKVEQQKLKSEDGDMTTEEENMFNEYQQARKTNNAPKIFLGLLVALILAAIIWAIWHYIFNSSQPDNITTTEGIVPVSDSSARSRDTAAILIPAPDSTGLRNAGDTSTFKIVVNEYRTPEAALRRMDKLKSFHRNVIMYTTDSVIYKIAEPFTLPLSDTTKMLNSLKRYYTRVYLEK